MMTIMQFKKPFVFVFLFVLIITIESSIKVCYAFSAPTEFTNPILSGFYPDPSITRVGDIYYITNSTFEWFPALPIHKSKDLVNWELIGYGISDPQNLNLHQGLKDSLGIFAPTIRYHNNKFYIITTCVGCGGNFIITADNAEGPWSKPLWIKDAIGIDPSLFWENDKAYYIGAGLLKSHKQDSNKWPGKNGIWMQQINTSTGELLGAPKQLTFGHAVNARWAEGPHLYKIGDEYLLLIGEGGTNEQHAVTVFNSKSLWGPYIANYANPVLTHRHLANTYPITQTGHADLVQTQNGDWWSVMLAKRPIDGFTLLARETFLAEVEMINTESGITPIFNPGKGLIQQKQRRPDLPWSPTTNNSSNSIIRDEFTQVELANYWNILRTPNSTWYQQSNGSLKLQVRPDSITSFDNPSMIARRFQHHHFTATTKLNFSPMKLNESAGLVVYRKSTNHYQLLKQQHNIVLIKTHITGTNGEVNNQEIAKIPYKNKQVIFQVNVTGNVAQFYYGGSYSNLKPIGPLQDITILSDEVTQRFNGNYVGMYATSLGELSNQVAEFDWFEYQPYTQNTKH